MDFDVASDVEQVCWDMRWHDQLSARHRAMVNYLFDGGPPYLPDEVRDNKIEVNVNYLDAPRLSHTALQQVKSALLSPEYLFTVQLDYGPKWQRQEWGEIITAAINKPLKESYPFLKTEEDVFKQMILHGPGTSAWMDRQSWRNRMMAVGDVLMPTKTLVTLENLEYFGLFVQFSETQLRNMTRGPRRDPGWNMSLVSKCLKWVVDERGQSSGLSESEMLSPERIGQLEKANRSQFSDDQTPTVDCWVFYYRSAKNRKWGWRRKIILDTPLGDVIGNQAPRRPGSDAKTFAGTRGEFLYDGGDRVWADHLSQILHVQMGNVSSVAPSYWHTVRSMGWLLYSMCHMQNRLLSQKTEFTFESLMQWYWANGNPDVQRIQEVNLSHRKVLPEGLKFVLPQERWQINEGLVDSIIGMNRQIISETASSYVQELSASGEQDSSETATKTMAKVNASAAVIGSMMADIYLMQEGKYREFSRRFCIVNSDDSDVNRFRNTVCRQGVPEEALNEDCWRVKATRTLANGNIMLATAMADKLMGIYDRLDPQAQQEAKRLFIWATSQDSALALRWVPSTPTPSPSKVNAQRDAAVLLQALPVAIAEGVNHEEVIQTYLMDLGLVVKRIQATGGLRDATELIGLQNLAGMSVEGAPFPDASLKQSNVRTHLELFIQQHPTTNARQSSPEVRDKAKQYSDALTQLINLVKGLAQQLAEKEAAKNGGDQQPQIDPKDRAKIAGMVAEKQAKIQLGAESHAAKTAQRDVQFQRQLAQEQQRHAADLAKKETEMEIAANRPEPKPKSAE